MIYVCRFVLHGAAIVIGLCSLWLIVVGYAHGHALVVYLFSYHPDGDGFAVDVEANDNTHISAQYRRNVLFIPSLGVHAPVIWAEEANDEVLLSALNHGVVHDPTTSLPGESGNVFIAGHSSQSSIFRGDYSMVFASLPRLQGGEKVMLTTATLRYEYRVEDVFRTHANDLSVMAHTKQPTLTLMTCWPIGTARDRFIVRAGLVGIYSIESGAMLSTFPADKT
jgi:LPXTG-site transpeptidase (sortase) family protein